MELRDRLRLALRTGRPASRAPLERSAPPGTELEPISPRPTSEITLPPGLRCVESDRGPVYVAETTWPLDHSHGRLRLGEALGLNRRAMARLAPGHEPGDLVQAAFVDVETTGLAGGTGTHAFLIGVGTFEGSFFRLRQFFLADLPGESAMLDATSQILSSSGFIVSFNGRRFDLPLLETRFTMNRLVIPDTSTRHLDLLYPARRLFRHRLPSCRLASLEQGPLRVQRKNDLPGSAIPGIYFEYLREGRSKLLSTVFRHNALDILSLVTLLACLGRIVGNEAPTDPEDCLALARWDESEGRPQEATGLFETALAASTNEHTRSLAFRHLVRLYRRQGRWTELGRVLWRHAQGGGPPEDKQHALVELAKLEEHRHRNYAAAEALTRQALATAEVMDLSSRLSVISPWRVALEHRLARLRRRQRCKRRRLESR